MSCSAFFFFFNDTATTEIYTLSLHDALPILPGIGFWIREFLKLKDMDSLADGIFIAKILALKRLIDDHQFPRVVDFRVSKAAPTQELNAQHREILVAAKLEGRGPRLVGYFAGNFDVGGNTGVGWKRARFRGGHHTRQ